MIIKTKKAALAAILMSGAISQTALAGLYVSPGMRDAVVFDKASVTQTKINKAGKSSAAKPGKQLSGKYGKKGNFLLAEKPIKALKGSKSKPAEKVKPAYRFGSNVPLFVAVEHIVPNDQYQVNIDDLISDRSISWEGGNTWKGVMKSIAEQNKLAITVNEREKVIGISTQTDISEALAQSERQVWRVLEGRTLKENLDVWAKQSGWNLYWDVEVDYSIPHSAVLFGDIKSSLDVLLTSFSDKLVPLSAELHKGNKVIQIDEGGYRRGE